MQRNHRPIHILVVFVLLITMLLPKSAQAGHSALASVPGFTLLADINPGLGNSMDPYLSSGAVAFGNNVFFFANNQVSGWEPWITNGTPQGTVMIKETNPGILGVWKQNGAMIRPQVWNGKVFFAGMTIGADGIGVPQLWVSDGTANGTYSVDNAPHNIQTFFPANSGILFQEVSQISNNYVASIWWTDGTPGNTFMLYSWLSNNYSPGVSNAVQIGNEVYFRLQESLLKIDLATRQSSVIVSSGLVTIFQNVNGLLFFSRKTAEYGEELWQTDGTPNGTSLVADLSPGSLSTFFRQTMRYSTTLAFLATVRTSQADFSALYLTSGKDVGVGVLTSSDIILASMNQVSGMLFFNRWKTGGTETWRSDGTPAGTFPICSTCLHAVTSYSDGFPGHILYSARDAMGDEIWVTDGTENGTHRLIDFNPGGLSSSMNDRVVMDGWMFLTANNGTLGSEPWVYRPVDPRMAANRDTFLSVHGDQNPINVLANDVHLDGKTIYLTSFDTVSKNGGKLVRDERGTLGNLADDWIVYTPPSTFVGKDEFAYSIEDTTGNMTYGRVSIDVTILNRAPTDITFTPVGEPVREDTAIGTTVGTLSVTDPNVGDKHNCVLYIPPEPFTISGMKVITNAPLNYEAQTIHAFNVICTDQGGLSFSKDILIPIQNINEPPILNVASAQTVAEDSTTNEWQVGWVDPESNVSTFGITQFPAHGTASLTDCLGSSCTLRYQPAANYVGADSFKLTVTDAGGLITQATVNITVTAGDDDAPVMKPVYNIVRPNAVAEYRLKLEGIAAGPYETGPVTVGVETDKPTMLEGLAVDYTSGTSGWLSFTLQPGEGTAAQVTITLNDGVNQTPYTFNVLVIDNTPLYIPMITR